MMNIIQAVAAAAAINISEKLMNLFEGRQKSHAVKYI